MNFIQRVTVAAVASGVLFSFGYAEPSLARSGLQDAQQSSSAASRQLGTIKSISGSNMVLTADSGSEVSVLVPASTRMVRVAPGQKDLKDAVPVMFKELQAGDRVLVRGTASPDGKSLTASLVVLMKSFDVAQKRERELQDWEKRGTGGLVSAVDQAAGTILITSGTKQITVRSTKDTVVRRYTPGSVKFEDAVVAKLEDIKAGDQLRARGNHNADGSELAAEEIVAGTFRNVAGLITSIDTSAQTITVNDLSTKKPVVVKITSDSQLHALPEMMAQGIAMRLRATRTGAGGGGENGGRRSEAIRAAEGPRPQQGGGSQFAGRGQRNGGADLHQMLGRMPATTFAELKKGDAVMIVTTQAQASTLFTAIMLLTGVDPILRASPDDAAMLLSPWNLGGGGGESGAGAPPQ